jgi:hypothetical protein
MKNVLVFTAFMLLWVMGVAQQNTSLSQLENDAILFMREEEKLARDIYDSMYVKWGGNPFGNIRYSEQVHMDKMKTLINTYKLQDPVVVTNDIHGKFANPTLQQYYNELAVAGSQSLTAALKAGAKIEELDITDLEERIKQSQRQDVISSFELLKMASHNHLRAFVRRLKMEGVNYEPVILGKVKFNNIIKAENTKDGCGQKCD